MLRTSVPTLSRLYRELRSAEETEQRYAELLALVEHSARYQAEEAGGIFHVEAERLRNLVAEFEADADEQREAILAAGGSPEGYDQWLRRELAR